MFQSLLVRTGFVCLALSSLSGLASAQTKVAVINLQKAVLESNEIKKASTALETKYRPRQQELEKLQADLERIQQTLQNGQGKLSPQGEADLQAEGTRKQTSLTRKSEDLQKEVDAERNEILAKSSKQMQEVVSKLAADKGYDVVVDVSNTVFFKPALEITNDAIAAYNAAYPGK
jgi:outer membrane protein